MKRSVLRMVTLALCALMMLAAFVGCDKPATEAEQAAKTAQSQQQANGTKLPPQPSRPTDAAPVAVGDDCALLGEWMVQSDIGMTAATFHNDGTATLVYGDNSKYATFTVSDGNSVTLTASGSSIAGTYTVSDSNIVIVTESGTTLTLTK